MRRFWTFLFHLFLKGHGISILVPLNVADSEDRRAKNWKWLRQYWETNLPGAEIVLGLDNEASHKAFSKSAAINNAANKAHGDIFVIVDADIYISIESVLRCVKEIRLAEKKNRSLWFIPYRQAFRLTKVVSEKIITSDPKTPLDITPTESEITNISKQGQKTHPSRMAHWYGAMIHIVSRKAFYTVGGWDERFRGWGGEDYAAMAAMDTLYGPHKTLPSKVIHLWHPVLTPGSVEEDAKAKKRLWRNQKPDASNDDLSILYSWAYRNKTKMRELVNSRNTLPTEIPYIEPEDPSIDSE